MCGGPWHGVSRSIGNGTPLVLDWRVMAPKPAKQILLQGDMGCAEVLDQTKSVQMAGRCLSGHALYWASHLPCILSLSHSLTQSLSPSQFPFLSCFLLWSRISGITYFTRYITVYSLLTQMCFKVTHKENIPRWTLATVEPSMYSYKQYVWPLWCLWQLHKQYELQGYSYSYLLLESQRMVWILPCMQGFF